MSETYEMLREEAKRRRKRGVFLLAKYLDTYVVLISYFVRWAESFKLGSNTWDPCWSNYCMHLRKWVQNITATIS